MATDQEKAKIDLGLLEEDDEFEEFPAEGTYKSNMYFQLNSIVCFLCPPDWTSTQEAEDEVNVWEDNWDDDNVEDDFNLQLRAQLESQKK